MEIVTLTLGPYSQHTYIVREKGFCGVIDPEINGGRIMEALSSRGWEPTHILITHAHFDHVRGVNDLPGSAALYIHELEAPFLPEKNDEIGMPYQKEMAITRPFTTLADGDTVGPFTVMHTPGHSPGSVIFIAPGHVFSGDSLFVRGIPLLSLRYSDPGAYTRSVERMEKTLDKEAALHCGHGVGGRVWEGIPQWD